MPRKGTHNPSQEYIVIDGIYFYKERTGNYYLGNVLGEDGKKHPVRAHRYVWEKYNGKIPNGCHIHHYDGNTANNDISNLTLISSHVHQSMHMHYRRDESSQRMNEIVRPAAIEWHQSEAGSEWHKEHYKDVTQSIWQEPVEKVCTVCGKTYTTNHGSAWKSKYCSQQCKNKNPLRKEYQKTHQEERICPICGKTFLVYKYSRTVTCGKECANISQSRKKKGQPRPY